jgi:hypothetical protein
MRGGRALPGRNALSQRHLGGYNASTDKEGRVTLSFTSAAMAVLISLLSFVAAAQVPSSHNGTPQSTKKEYVYPDYGFAITVPQPPKETGVTGGTQFRLYWNESWDADKAVVLNLTAGRGPTDCEAWLNWERDTIAKYSSATFHGLPVTASSKVVTIEGNLAVESEAMRNAMQAGYQRQLCLNYRLYSFEAGFPKGQQRPEIIDEILKTFRILAQEAKP